MTEYANPSAVKLGPGYANPDSVVPVSASNDAPERGFFDDYRPASLATLPAAVRDVVLRQIQENDPSVLSMPAVQPMLLDLLKTHPDLAKFAGATAGTVIGTPAGPAGMIAGGAAGASAMDSAAQLAQMGTKDAPQSVGDTLARSGTAIGEGALAGATGAGALAGAPKALRFAATPIGSGLIAGGTTLAKTHDPWRALEVAGVTAAGLKTIPGAQKALTGLAGKLATKIENFALNARAAAPAATTPTLTNAALNARLAHTLTREAPEAVAATAKILKFSPASSSLPGEIAATLPKGAQGATAAARALEGAGLSPELATAEAAKMGAASGEVSGSLPGVFTPPKGTPAVKLPELALAENIQGQVATLRASGLSKPQITDLVRTTHNLTPKAAGEVVETIFQHPGGTVAATTTVLPKGSKVMPPYRGGKAQPSLGPARVPENDQDLMSLLQKTYDSYKIP